MRAQPFHKKAARPIIPMEKPINLEASQPDRLSVARRFKDSTHYANSFNSISSRLIIC